MQVEITVRSSRRIEAPVVGIAADSFERVRVCSTRSSMVSCQRMEMMHAKRIIGTQSNEKEGCHVV